MAAIDTTPASEPMPSSEAARYIGMSHSWLRQTRINTKFRVNGGPPFVRVGARSIRYLRADLDYWLAQRRCSVNEPKAEREPAPHDAGRAARRRRRIKPQG